MKRLQSIARNRVVRASSFGNSFGHFLLMIDATDAYPLPDYDAPPVAETVLGVQFDRLSGFKSAHLGAFWKLLDVEEWPVVQDVPPLPPQFERFGASGRWAKGIQLQVTQDPASRLQIKRKDGDRMIQLQNGRLHFNWLGGTGERYPRYERVRDEFQAVLRRFIEFVGQERVGQFRPNQWEVTYVNTIPRGTVWKTPEDWNFFRLLAGLPAFDNLLIGESFSGEWHFAIPGQRGRLHVHWHHGVREAAEGSEDEIVQLTFTARGSFEEGDNLFRAITDGLDLGRRTIVSSFRRLMSDEANDYWGLKTHASD